MSDTEKKGYLDAWRQFKDDHPVAYGVAVVAPVTGQLAAVADYADAMDRGDSVDGAIAAASLIPGVKLGKYATKLAPASLRLKSQMTAAEKAIAPLTKRSTAIGRSADAEQIGETMTHEKQQLDADREKEEQQRARERMEYATEWSNLG